MFKKIETNITLENGDSGIVLTYTPSFGSECKVKSAIIKLRVNATGAVGRYDVLYGEKIIDHIKPTRAYAYINITEELIDAMTKGESVLRIKLKPNTESSISVNVAESRVFVGYVPNNAFMKNRIVREISAGRAGNGAIDLTTGKMQFAHYDASVKANAMSLSIYHCYAKGIDDFASKVGIAALNCGKDWKLNVQQYLKKEIDADLSDSETAKRFVYFDGNGNRHMFEEKYYYEDGGRHYLSLGDIRIDENHNLFFDKTIDENLTKTYKVKKVVKSSAGLELTSELEGFKNIDLIQTNIDEIEQLQAQIKQQEKLKEEYAESIEKLNHNKTDLTTTYNITKLRETVQSRSLDLENNRIEYADEVFQYNNSNEVLQTDILGEEIKNLKAEYEKNERIIEIKEKLQKNYSAIHLLNVLHHTGIPEGNISSGYESDVKNRKDVYDQNRNLLRQSQNYSSANYLYQCDLIDKEIEKYQNEKDECDINIKMLQLQLKTLQKQVPMQYITDGDGVVYGFAETGREEDKGTLYRLVMLADKWENVIYIAYDEDDRIAQIVDGDNSSAIIFKYDDEGMLASITDERGRATKFKYEGKKLVRIEYANGEKSEFRYDSASRLYFAATQSGQGVQLTYKNDFVTGVNALPVKQSLEKDMTVISYIDSGCTTVTDEDGQKVTYLFDVDDKPFTVYESDSDGEVVNVRSFDRTDEEVAYAITAKPYSDDYLLGSCHKDKDGNEVCTHAYVSDNYLGDTLCEEGIVASNYATETADEYSLSSTDGYLYRDVPDVMLEAMRSSGKKDFILSAWAKADSACVTRRCTSFGNVTTVDEFMREYENGADELQKARRFELRAEIKYQGKTEKDEFYASFDWQQQEWQYCALPVVLSEEEGDIVESIRVYFDYSSNTGSALLKDMKLKEGDWQYSEFNADGQKTYEESSSTKSTVKYTYDEDKRLVGTTITDKNKKMFVSRNDYNHVGALVRSVDYNGIVTEHCYNDKGIVTKTVTYHKDEPANRFYDEKLLDEKGNEIGGINEFGEKVYDYEYSGDLLLSKTDKYGNKTAYGYDHNDDTLLSITADVDGEQNGNVMGYTGDKLTKLTHNGTDIEYAFDTYGRTTGIKVAGENYCSNNYSEDEKTATTNYANGFAYTEITDKRGNLIEVKHDDQTAISNVYDTSGRLIVSEDKVADTRKKIIYDDNGNICKQTCTGLDKDIVVETTYDEDNNVSASSVSIGDTTRETSYTYDASTPDVKLASVTLPNGVKQQSVYDKLGRLCEIKQDRNFVTFGKQLYYKQVGDHASNLIASEWFEKNGVVKERLHYTYDEKGNITAIKQNNTIIARYTYDSLSRLIREDNKLLDKTTVMTYDIGGNILSKTEYPYSQKETANLDNPINAYTYEYASNGWKDQLVTYNGQGVGNYDDLGNPRIYRDKRLIWSHGRQLDLIGNIRYRYDASGVRVSKNVDGVITKFYTDGTTIFAQACGEDTLIFTRGIDGLNGFALNGTEYIYKKNVQGDIIAIMDVNGTELVHYTYDAWGNHTVQVLEDGAYTDEPTSNAYMKIAEINPFRYRSYYYDVETGLYYLNTRYYDPEVGRFINADDISYADPEQINGFNLYAYCLDNPINYQDSNGCFGVLAALLIALAVIVSPIGGVVVQKIASVGMYLGFAFASLFDPQIKGDMEAIGWNPFNMDENKVLDSKKVSFYKGLPVIRTNFERSGMLAVIYLCQNQDADDIRHEYGHVFQLLTMGLVKYGLYVGIPSASKMDKHKWETNSDYYNSPWDAYADVFGGVESRPHTDKQKKRALAHIIVAILFGPFSYLFAI